MKIKTLLALLAAGTLAAGAQSQGYLDGIDYYRAGQYENARSILSRTLNDSNTDKAVANYYLGQVYLNQDKPSDAKAAFEAGIAANADCPYNYIGLGALDLRNGNESAAQANFKKAQSLAKKNTEIPVDIARAYYNADPVKYAKEITKNLDKARKDSKYSEPAVFMLEGDMLLARRKFGEAAAMYEQAINAEAGNPEGYVKYANSYFFVNPDFAIQKLQEFVSANPNSALAQRELAEKYYENNQWTKAAEQYGKYINNPNHFADDEARYTVLLYAGQKYGESLKIAQNLLARHPENMGMQRMVMLNKDALEDYKGAIEAGKQLFEKNPASSRNYNDYLTLGRAYMNDGQDSLSVVVLTEGIKAFPDKKDLYGILSTAYSQMRNHPEAAEAYAKYISMSEDVPASEYFDAARRYMNASISTYDSEPARSAEYAKKGVEMMDLCIAGAQPVPVLYQQKGRLVVAANGRKPNQAAADAYLKELELLNENPENMTTSAGLAMYREAYQVLNSYYKEIGDKEKAAETFQKYQDVTTALQNLSK